MDTQAGSTGLVLGLAGLLGVLLGATMHRVRFCTMGAISDWINLGDFNRMRQWLVAMATAIVCTQILWAGDLIHVETSFYLVPVLRWLSYLLGGLLFGFGMVLASGCGSKTLIRMGAGSLKALVVFLVMGISAYLTLRGILATARVQWLEPVAVPLGSAQDLPRVLLGEDLSAAGRIAAALCVAGLLLLIALWGIARAQLAEALSGTLVGVMVPALWFVSASLGYVEEHPDTLEEAFLATNSRGPESFSFVAPMAYTLDYLILHSDRSKTLTIGIVSVLGVVLGAMLDARRSGQFRIEGFQGTEDTSMHLLGAVLMGVGGVIAFGCTIGQGLSAVSLLALSAFITLPAIVAGAWLAMRWQFGRL